MSEYNIINHADINPSPPPGRDPGATAGSGPDISRLGSLYMDEAIIAHWSYYFYMCIQ